MHAQVRAMDSTRGRRHWERNGRLDNFSMAISIAISIAILPDLALRFFSFLSVPLNLQRPHKAATALSEVSGVTTVRCSIDCACEQDNRVLALVIL